MRFFRFPFFAALSAARVYNTVNTKLYYTGH